MGIESYHGVRLAVSVQMVPGSCRRFRSVANPDVPITSRNVFPFSKGLYRRVDVPSRLEVLRYLFLQRRAKATHFAEADRFSFAN